MRVLYLAGPIDTLRTGGQIYHYKLLNALTSKSDVVYEDGSALQTCNKLVANWRYLLRILRAKSEVLVEEGYSYYCSLFLCNWALRILGFRIVSIVQGIHDTSFLSSWRKWIHRFIMMLYLRSANVVIANSHYTKAMLVEVYKMPARSVIVLSPTGQSFEINSSDVPPEFRDRFILLSVANVEAKKGQKYLIEAMRYLADLDCYLYLIGGVKEPDYYRDLLQIIEKHQLTHRVRMKGFLRGRALAEAYRSATIFVHSALREGYGMVILEAMSLGLPVIATQVGGIPEIITHGVDGILVPPGDARMLAEAIRRLCLDGDLRRRLSINARRRWESMPRWEDIEQQFYDLLQRVASPSV